MSQGRELPPFSPQQQAALKKEWENANRRAELAKQEGFEIGRIAVGDQITANFLVPGDRERNIPARNESVTALYQGRRNDGSFIFTQLPQPEAPRAPVAQPLPLTTGGFGPNNNQQFGPTGTDSWPEPQYSQPPSQPPEPRVEYEGSYSVMGGGFNEPDEVANTGTPAERPSRATPDELRQRDPEATDVYPIDDIQSASGEKPVEEAVEPPEAETYIPQGGVANQGVIGEDVKPEGPAPEGPQRWHGHNREKIFEDDDAHNRLSRGPNGFIIGG